MVGRYWGLTPYQHLWSYHRDVSLSGDESSNGIDNTANKYGPQNDDEIEYVDTNAGDDDVHQDVIKSGS